MNRICSLVLAMAALGGSLACGGDDTKPEPSGPANQPASGCAPISGMRYCATSMCFEESAPLSGVCATESDPPSSGLHVVCLVSPEGALYNAWVQGSSVIEGTGWTHSAYGNGLVPSTLSEADL